MPAPKKRLTRAEQKEQRHREILEAAWALFCEYGYEAVTIDQVAEQVGVSKMPVYYAFGDKQNLFLELWKREVSGLLSTIGSIAKPGGTLRENVGTLAQMTAEAHQKSQTNPGENLFFVIQTIALSRPDIAEEVEDIARGNVEYFAAFIRASKLEKGQKLRAAPDAVAAHIVAVLNGLATVRFQTGRVDITAESLTDILLSVALDIKP